MVNFSLNIRPISLNECYQGRRFHSKKGKAYRKAYLLLMPRIETITGFLQVEVIVYLKKNWIMPDSDNFLKPLLDAMVERGIIKDDRYITDLTVRKRPGKEDRIDIFIEKVGIIKE